MNEAHPALLNWLCICHKAQGLTQPEFVGRVEVSRKATNLTENGVHVSIMGPVLKIVKTSCWSDS